MRARYWLLFVLLAGAGVIVWRVQVAKSRPPEIPFARVIRETITSSVPTNGQVQPVESAVAHAERSGAVNQILIKNGDHVKKGQELARLDTSEIEAEKAQAESNIAQIKTELQVIDNGGRAADRARIQGDLDRAQLELQQARDDYEKYQRLQAKQVATAAEVLARKQKVDQLALQIKDLNNQKAALVAPTDRASANARLQSAQSALKLAEERIAQSVVRAPIDGEIYQFDLKQGAYLNAGDAVASIGRLDRVKVTVYVDERDLGRVRRDMPVRITWDAFPGREWMGVVDKLAEQVIARGSREVGEVECVIENPGRELVPGSNVNVDIRAESVESALTIPKEALRNENGREGVYTLEGDRLQWRTVKLGIDNTTRLQVVSGLSEGGSVALITDKTLKDGMPVTAVYP